MKKDKVIIYDGGFIDYEQWNAPIIMDLQGLSMNLSSDITAYGYEESKTAFAFPFIDNSKTLYAVVNGCREDIDIRYGYKIVAKEGRYLMPKETIAINGRTLEITDAGAWLVSKATLIRITATKGDKPTLEFMQEDDYLRTLGTKKGQDGEKKMDMETLNPCSEVLQKANNQSTEKLVAEFTAEELKDFDNGKTHLSVPLVYEDEDKIQHNAGEVTLTHVKYGETNNEGIIAETFCWPYQLNDVGTHEVVFALQVYTQDMDLISFEFACDASPSRHVGFLPFGLDCIVPVNVKISRKTNGQKHDNTSSEHLNASQKKIAETCDAIKNLLLEKNRKYGDSALNPVRVFSKTDTVEQIKVRMDDKLSRIKNEQDDEDEDVYMDLAGYLVLMLIAKEEQKKTKGETDK